MGNKGDLLTIIQNELATFEKTFPLDSFRAGDYAQHPFATLLTCCDARVPSTILGDPFNRVFCIENIGNQVRNSQGSVQYGLLHLNTPLMLVAGHTDCGAIKASNSDYQEEPAALKAELDMVKNSLQEGQGERIAPNQDEARCYAEMAELNVDVQINCLREDKAILKRMEEGRLMVIGLMVDLHNQYGDGYGRIYITNCNGITDTESLKKEPALKAAADRIRRLTENK